jgi:HK97 family phage portal protein
LPLHFYERKGKGRDRAPSYYLYPLLHDEGPNEHMTAMEFRETLQGHLAGWGNAYCQIEHDKRTGKITELWPLNPANMVETKMVDGERFYRYQNPEGKLQWIAGQIIWHMRGLGGDGLHGYSPISLMRRAIGLGMAAESFGARFFANDARPGIVLEHPGRLGDEAQKNLRESWDDSHRGLSKSHRVAILEEGLKLHEVGIPPEDAQFLETREFQVTEIARIFRIPPHMIQDLLRSTNNNIEHQGIEFVVYTMQPWIIRWEQSIKKILMLPNERARYYPEYLVDGLLRGDTQSRYQAYATGKQWGWFSTNDIRERENLNPVEGGDTYWMPLNMVPMGSEPTLITSTARGAAERLLELESRNRMEARGRTAARGRHALMGAYQGIYLRTAKKVLKAERESVTAVAREEQVGRIEFEQWMNRYYDDLANEIIDRFMPIGMDYGEDVGAAAIEELGSDGQFKAEIEAFIKNYVGGYAARHTGISKDRLRQAIQQALRDGADWIEAVDAETASWEESRSAQIAGEESVRFNNAVAKKAYMLMGVERLMSVAFGENCPYCDDLDGTVIAINSYFLNAGESYQPEGAEAPLTSTTNLGHAPYHEGCDCMVVAG